MASFKSRQNIMVIEDDPNCQEILQNVLEESYNITVVGNTQEALLLLMDAPTTYSLILLELELPDDACIEFLKQRSAQSFLLSSLQEKAMTTGVTNWAPTNSYESP